MLFKLQVHDLYPGDKSDPALRIPRRSEIFAGAYIALAHGAKGISFFKYRTNKADAEDSMHGLVNKDYEHPVGPPWYYNERWEAVRDLYAELGAMGDVLKTLQRDAAFCAKDGGFIAPLTNVYFEEESRGSAWIEVGQFHDAEANYLILVNRRTDADRHVVVEMDLTGESILEDIYTGEEFASTNGQFTGIPFDAGAGRVFRIVP
jgi:hypothetical protein